MRRAALFDMDRTLVRREPASLYVRYQRSRGNAGWRDTARVTFWVAQYTLGVIDAESVAIRALRELEGTPETVLSARCDDWFTLLVEQHVTDKGRRAVEAHRERGDLLAIVTGASPFTARPLARLLRIEHLVCSELELDDRGRFTGKPVAPLCFGRGKVARAERFAEEQGFRLEDDATFYSDSLTDLPLLERVGEPIVVNPDSRLARVARKRGWPIERW
jgi:HAD superfamily hydrolase (TIGR01490 family)